MAPSVRLARRAVKDLDQIPDKTANRILDALQQLGQEPDVLDVKTLSGRRPWRRLRVGVYRVIFRPVGQGFLVARVVHRRELERAVRTLPDPR